MSTDEFADVISESQAKNFKKRWIKLRASQVKLDWEVASLAREVRDCFPGGPSGNYQFRLWTMSQFNIYAATAAMLCRAAHAHAVWPNQETWESLNGWASLGFALTLKPAGRNKVVSKALQIAMERGRPVSYTTVRNLAFLLNAVQDNNNGRPNRLKVEENLGLVRGWVARLYDEYDLPDPPEEIKQALKLSKLAKITKLAKGA